jgi:hypothetical protein
MTWELLIPIIAKHGIPYAFELWRIIAKYEKPTPEAWDELMALSQKPLDQYIKEAEARKNAQ